MIDSRLRQYVQFLFDALARGCGSLGLHPDQLTLAALITGCLSALAIVPGWYGAALILLWLSGLLDVLDGSLARLKGISSPRGAYMDMIFDRVVEILFVMAFAYSRQDTVWAVMAFLGSVVFNFSTFMLAGSLFPNRGEKSIHYDPGLAERTETFLVFSLMLLMPRGAGWILWGFNLLIVLTGLRRFIKILAVPEDTGESGGSGE